MNERTELLSKTFRPELSIVVYSSNPGNNYASNYYLESHQINEDGRVMEGKPLMQETLQGIISVLQQEQKDRSLLSGFVAENILFYKALPAGKYYLVWYRPEEIRYFHFALQLKLTSGKMWAPPMLYVADGGELYIYALKSNNRPTEKTKLMRGPFHNVSDDGKVCLGNANIKRPSYRHFSSTIKYWEDLFWLSEFAHLNGFSNPTKSPMNELYKKMLASKTKLKWSALKEFKESKKQINQILQ